MRFSYLALLALVVCFAVSCAKKPPTSSPRQSPPPALESEQSAPAAAGIPDAADQQKSTSTHSDPCDGGETKSKPETK
jgi:hypothetical protein